MSCVVCGAPTQAGPYCLTCAAKVQRVYPANRFLVDRAAKRALRVASKAIHTTEDQGETLADYTISGFGAGRRW